MSRSAVAPVATGDTTDVLADLRTTDRPRWYREILLVVLCYSAYSFVRNLVPTVDTAALARGREILRFEGALHLNAESSLNHLFATEHWLGIGGGYYYSTLHFLLTPCVLIWLYIRHPYRYVFHRRVITATTVLALVGFWLVPLAPPRMLPGFVDTVLLFHIVGLDASGASPVASVSNPYAAMPSLHTAWALWCALAVVDVARSRWTKAAAVCHPVATVIVILGTANHYLFDAVGGMLTLGAGYAVARGARVVIPRLDPAGRVFSAD